MAKVVTLSDVAAAAKVDLSTASRVLRGGGRVSAATRQRILDTAAELEFLPNAQAQFLAKGISKTVGVLTMRASGVFAMPVLAGVSASLGLKDIATLMYDAHFDDAALQESVRKLRARRIDGLLVLGDGLMDPIQSVSGGFDVPVVYAFAKSDSPDDAWFLPDGIMAGRIAGQHLVDLGRTKIAHITAAVDFAAHERAEGLRQVLTENGLELALGAPLEGTWLRAWGAKAARDLLESKADIDAIFCGNDQIALGVYGVFRSAGVRIPDDIALVGVDNWEGMIASGPNLLTTVDPNLFQVGAAAGEYVSTVTREEYVPGVHHQACTLIIGESTMGSGADGPIDPEGLV